MKMKRRKRGSIITLLQHAYTSIFKRRQPKRVHDTDENMRHIVEAAKKRRVREIDGRRTREKKKKPTASSTEREDPRSASQGRI
jgi:hypothetical protein